MDLADAEGLEAVSMSRVAEKVGCATMALYRYVTGKDELLMLMVETAAQPMPAPEPAPDWRAGMEFFARHQRGLFHRHPWVTQLPLSGPPITPNQIAMMEVGLSAMA